MKNVRTMTLEEKIGQMFMVGFSGKEPSVEIQTMIEQYHVGGVIYFTRNIESPEQVHRLSSELQRFVPTNPLFISIDQEGGMVARITEGVTLSPGNMALGATQNKEAVYQLNKIVASELTALGINMNFSPCIDVNNNPKNPVIGVRSYGEDPYFVAAMGNQAIDGLQSENVSAVIKHFPGHGDTNVDSHLSLPVISHSLERLKELELIPFASAIKQGVDAVMVAHVSFPAIEPDNVPATLSKRMINGLLRNYLQYDGVVMTDCMEMNAIINYYGIEEAAIHAIEAGNDIVLISHTFERQERALKAVIAAVNDGRITEETINQSVERILRLKQKRQLQKEMPNWNSAKKKIAQSDNLAYAQKISEQSITVIKDNGILPIDKDSNTLLVSVNPNVATEVDETLATNVTIGTYLGQHIASLEEVHITTTVTDLEMAEIMLKAKNADKVIVTTYQASANPSQVALVQMLLKQYDEKLAVIALRSPYDIEHFPNVATYIATYESRPLALQSVSKVLIGELQAIGQLPVQLPMDVYRS